VGSSGCQPLPQRYGSGEEKPRQRSCLSGLRPSCHHNSRRFLAAQANAVQFAANALKFTRQGTVGLQVKHEGVFLHFTVWDTGIGISAEEQAQLFQPYLNCRSSGRHWFRFSADQKLAELHSGWVEVSPKSITVHCLTSHTRAALGGRSREERGNGVPTQSGLGAKHRRGSSPHQPQLRLQ